jgi:two-component system chemotaxis response regulator CheY
MSNLVTAQPNDSMKPIEHVNVSLDVVWHGSAGKYDARMGEISLKGCFIDSMGQEVLGETISFKVRLPSGIWVTLLGEVVYQEYPIGFEVRFTNLTQENQKLITQVVAAHGGQQAQQILNGEHEAAVSVTGAPDCRRVLVADDEAMTLRMLNVIIEEQGFEVVVASDGREAFRILQNDGDFCAAVFDMMMPHLLGMDLIHFMKTDARLRQIPIGMITAEQDPKIWDESAAAGAKVFLPKPFSPPQIQMMLRMLTAGN